MSGLGGERPEFQPFLEEHPELSFLAALPEVEPDHLEPMDDPEELIALTDALAGYTRAVLIYWQPLLPKVLAGETRVPLNDLNQTAALVQAAGIALAAVDDAGCKAALERLQHALAALRKYTTDNRGARHLQASRYEAPAEAAPTSSKKKTKAGSSGGYRSGSRSLLLGVLGFAVLVAAIGHGLRVWQHTPITDELTLIDYQDVVPEVVERSVGVNGLVLVTVRNEWQKQPIGDRTNDLMLLLNHTAKEGWTRMTIQNEAGSALMRLDERGSVTVLRE